MVSGVERLVCLEDTLGGMQNGQEVLSMDGLSQPGRGIRHFLEHVSERSCAICKKWNSSNSGYVDGMTMLVCDQCGREYHVSCLKDSGMDNLNELPEGEWFCEKDCMGIDAILTQLVANGPEPLSDSFISRALESRQQQFKEKAESSSPSFEWQILCGKAGNIANTKTLSEAMNLFAECLDPIKDTNTGRNLVPLMVHSKRSKNYDFEGLFCIVLKLNEKVVSAALLQIFGREIAEVPLVATSVLHQGQGFCTAVMTTVERLLGVLSVKRLVLPAPLNTESIWINKFGCSQLEDEQVSEICRTIRLLMFTGCSMVGKLITPLAVN